MSFYVFLIYETFTKYEVLFYPKIYMPALFKLLVYINIYSDPENMYFNDNENII